MIRSIVPIQPRRTIIALVAAAAVGLTACGGTPPKPALTDPKAILTVAAEAAAGASGVHIDASADGSVRLDMFGAGGAGGPVDLSGSTASVDVDLQGGDIRATFALASLVRGEVLTVDGTTYLKTTMTGARYQVQDGGPLITAGAVPGAINALIRLIEQPGIDPVKEADVECAGGMCYHVTLRLAPEDLEALGAGALPFDLLGDASVDLDVLVSTSTYALSAIDAVATAPDGQALTLGFLFSKWDQAVEVEAPAADEIVPAGG